MTQIEFDFSAAVEAGDEGMLIAAANSLSWFDAALQIIATLPAGWTGLGEDIRALISASDVGPATSPKAWGALIGQAKRDGLLERTGVWRQMRDKKSHARETPEYRRSEKGLRQ